MDPRAILSHLRRFAVIAVTGVSLLACAPVTSETAQTSAANSCARALPTPRAGCSSSCSALTGTAWVPSVTGMAVGNHDTVNTSIAAAVTTRTGVPITGLAQAAPSSREISVTIDMTSDLGPYGSLTLEAKVKNYPSGLSGSAYPLLVYLSDGTNDFINLARTGAAGDCAQAGYYTCIGGSCYVNSTCKINSPSAYTSRTQWEQRQITAQNTANVCDPYPSLNTFPTCNWTEGTTPPTSASPVCAFNSTFFDTVPAGPVRLRYGGTYTAKYVLLATDYSALSDYTADLEVTATKKADNTVAAGGGVDLNVVLVGSQNVQASRTVAGKRNLNTLFQAVYDYYNQASTGIKLGRINAVEWGCDYCGDSYANLDIESLNELFVNGSGLLPSGTAGNAINLYLVSTLPYSALGPGLTVLGISGGIGGPLQNGTPNSGVAFSSFNMLGTYNATCAVTPCPATTQDVDFWDLGGTIAHEMGHYLGLNHPSEADGTQHDMVYDTPMCTATDPAMPGYITGTSCRTLDTHKLPPVTGTTCSADCAPYSAAAGTFCPAVQSCQFNHMMWWSNKNYKKSTGTGDGNLFSTDSGRILNYNPFIL